MKQIRILNKEQEELLDNIDSVLIGNGNGSRLDIFLDTATGEVWTREFYDSEQNSWAEYKDENIVKIGAVSNYLITKDEYGHDLEEDDYGMGWSGGICGPNDDEESGDSWGGDSWNNCINCDMIIDSIAAVWQDYINA